MTDKLEKQHLTQALNNMFEQAQGVKGWDTRYIPKSVNPVSHNDLKIKAIAFYLPQYHPIPENDAWWGKGFTEWTNVTKAVPQFLGHHQPRLPGELGFYDLRVPDVLRQQAALARHYGIYGFCFYHYWFGGKQLLEKPLQILLENKDIDINYCLCWANENWSRKWDGLENDVLIAQNHSPEDDIEFIDSLMEYFSDPRYIRIDDKPVLLVYRATLLPDVNATTDRWRKRAIEKGFKGLYLVAVKSFDIEDPTALGCDAAAEFPPHKMQPEVVTEKQVILNPDYTGVVYDYKDAVRIAKEAKHEGHLCFRGIMPSWDNEARRPGNGFSFINSTTDNYADWLNYICEETMGYPDDKRMVFINAWNEWAEGAHLEPDRKNGYAYLHATTNILRRFSSKESVINDCEKANERFVKKSDTCVVLHLYYQELTDELITQIEKIGNPDVFVSISNDSDSSVIKKFEDARINAYFLPVENIGRDIKPFLTLFCTKILPLKYEFCCKIHTKKSLHRKDGDTWRQGLYADMFNHEKVKTFFAAENSNAMLVPKNTITDLSVYEYHAGNIKWLSSLLDLFGLKEFSTEYNFNFVAGSMFWFRVSYLSDLVKASSLIDSFELELGQLDGTLAHSLERLFALLIEQKNGIVGEI